jgi:uncharacterized membrane protein YecN with MAPEG domain
MPVVTLIVAGLHGLLLLALLQPIVRLRRGLKIGLGDGGDPELLRRIRVHANFVEYVPMLLVLLGLLELGGLDRRIVAVLGAAVFAGRLLHAWGLGANAGYSTGRFWGTALTWLVLLAGSIAAIVLGVVRLAA